MSTPESLALAEQWRDDMNAARAVIVAEVVGLWRDVLDPEDMDGTARAWLLRVERLIRQWRGPVEQRAMQYYQRAVELDLGEPTLPPAGAVVGAALAASTGETIAGILGLLGQVPGGQSLVPDLGRESAVGSLVINGLDVYRNARARGLPRQAAEESASALAGEDAARMALDAGREHVRERVQRDRRARGWMRKTSTDPCAFCTVLASRGPVYKSRESATFASDPRGDIGRYHPSCRCVAVPVFVDDPTLPTQTHRAEQLYRESQQQAADENELRRGTANDSLNALRRYLNTLS